MSKQMSLYLGAALEDSAGIPEKLKSLGALVNCNKDLEGIGLVLLELGEQAADFRGRVENAQSELAGLSEANQ